MESSAAFAPSSPSPLPWYCLRSQPKHEQIAAVHLRRYAAVEVFSPRLRFQRPRLKGKMWTTEALFPGYLFARFDLATRWREIQHSHAVRGILRFGEKHPTIPDALIEPLRILMGPDELATVESSVEPGQGVQVVNGAFAGLQTVIMSYLPAKDRVKVLLHMLGRETEVEMPAAAVIPMKVDYPFRAT